MLIRALRSEWGVEVMRQRRPKGPLCAGPGRLTKALDVQITGNGKPFDGTDLVLRGAAAPQDNVICGPRIGITRAVDITWRFGLAGKPGLSRKF